MRTALFQMAAQVAVGKYPQNMPAAVDNAGQPLRGGVMG